MKLPQHPALPLVSVALLAYLCGDVACAVMERQFSNRPQRQQTAAAPVVAPGPGHPGELEALLNQHTVAAAPTPATGNLTNVGTNPGGQVPTAGNATVPLPNLLGTMEGQGSALAILQMPGSPDTAVVAVGDEYNGLKLMEVGAFQARMRDKRNQDWTISMAMANTTTAPTPPPPAFTQIPPSNNTVFQPPELPKGPYKTSRELREDIDNKGQWIKNILVQPAMRNGESIGVTINYKGGENPFSRLGIQSGDVVLSLNNKPAKAVENLPDILMELRNSQTLSFNLERNGQATPLTVNLEP
ncbi:PDZ domain-containing protein [bacterium]|nr:PDZ domain-containing protein [bacterium]